MKLFTLKNHKISHFFLVKNRQNLLELSTNHTMQMDGHPKPDKNNLKSIGHNNGYAFYGKFKPLLVGGYQLLNIPGLCYINSVCPPF
jgi:hypothetical protein